MPTSMYLSKVDDQHESGSGYWTRGNRTGGLERKTDSGTHAQQKGDLRVGQSLGGFFGLLGQDVRIPDDSYHESV